MRELAVLVCVAGACVPGPADQPTATATSGLSAPSGPLPMPPVDVEWTLPHLVAGNPERLRKELEGIEAAGVFSTEGIDPRALESVLHEMAPDAEFTTRPATPIFGVLGPTPLPLDRNEDVWSAEGIVVDPNFLEQAASVGDRTVVVLGDAPIDATAWHRWPARVVGSCDAVLSALGTGQGQSLAVVEPFLDHVDERLAVAYRKSLARALPVVRGDLETARARGGATAECAATWLGRLDAYEAALAGPHPLVPRVYLPGAPRIVTVEPPVAGTETCSELLQPDPYERLSASATAAARLVADELEVEWSELVSRVAALDEVQAALEDVCRPRRRRTREADVASLRARLEQAIEIYRFGHVVAPSRAGWVRNDEPFHVSGVGSARTLLEFSPGPDSPAREIVGLARGIRELALSRALCQGTTSGLPLALAVVDVERGTLRHFDYVYEEELVCLAAEPARGRLPSQR